MDSSSLRQQTDLTLRRKLIPGVPSVRMDCRVAPEALRAFDSCEYLWRGEGRLVQILKQIEQFYGSFSIIPPGSAFYAWWNAAVLLIVVFYLFEIGMLIGFGSDFWRFETDYLAGLNVVFLSVLAVDILLSPLKSYYEKGNMVVDRPSIFAHYRRVAWMDVLGLSSLLVPYIGDSLAVNVVKVFFIVKLLRVYEADKQLQVAIQLRSRLYSLYGMGRLLLIALLWAHYMGVVFYLIDNAIYRSNYYGPNTPMYCWIYNSPTEYGLMAHQPWYILYLYTMYYSVGNITTIAYGDIIPLNPLETVYTNVMMILSILVFTYFFKSLLELLVLSKQKHTDQKNALVLLFNFLRNHRVADALKQKIISYYEIQWRAKPDRDQEEQQRMIAQLSVPLRSQLIRSTTTLLQSLRLIAPTHASSEYQSRVLLALQTTWVHSGALLPSMGLYHACVKNAFTVGVGEPPQDIRVEIDVGSDECGVIQKTYEEKMVVCIMEGAIGANEFFFCGRRTYWVVTNKYIELTHINYEQYQDALLYATDKERQITTLAMENALQLTCYLCLKQGHSFATCSFTHWNTTEQNTHKQQRRPCERRKKGPSLLRKWASKDKDKDKEREREKEREKEKKNEEEDSVEECLREIRILVSDLKQQAWTEEKQEIEWFEWSHYKPEYNLSALLEKYREQCCL